MITAWTLGLGVIGAALFGVAITVFIAWHQQRVIIDYDDDPLDENISETNARNKIRRFIWQGKRDD